MIKDTSPSDIADNLRREIALIMDRPQSSISFTTPLAELGLDSIRLMEIIIFIENNYGFNLVDLGLTKEALQNINSLAKVVRDHG